MTMILPVANTEASSSTFTVASGEVKRLALASSAALSLSGTHVVKVETQTNSVWQQISVLRSNNLLLRTLRIDAPGTYRVTRPAQAESVGVDLE